MITLDSVWVGAASDGCMRVRLRATPWTRNDRQRPCVGVGSGDRNKSTQPVRQQYEMGAFIRPGFIRSGYNRARHTQIMTVPDSNTPTVGSQNCRAMILGSNLVRVSFVFQSGSAENLKGARRLSSHTFCGKDSHTNACRIRDGLVKSLPDPQTGSF